MKNSRMKHSIVCPNTYLWLNYYRLRYVVTFYLQVLNWNVLIEKVNEIKTVLQINSENHKKRLNLLFHKNKHLNVPRIIVSVFVRF